MSLDLIKEAGGFVDPEPVAKEITWKHHDAEGKPVTHIFTVYVRRQSFGEVQKLFAKPDGEEARAFAAQYIATSLILGEKKDEVLTYEAAYNLNPSLAKLFTDAINEVNAKASAAKNLTPPTSSGTN